MKPLKVYVIGSLRNPRIPEVAKQLREHGLEVFDDWYAAGPEADDAWRQYEKDRGHTYAQALQGHAARHVFEFDKKHLDSCDAAIMVGPAGRSAHLELGYILGQGKPGFILLDQTTEDARWDVMYQFATRVSSDLDAIAEDLIDQQGASIPHIELQEPVTFSVPLVPPPAGWHQAAAQLIGGEDFDDRRYLVHGSDLAP